MNSTNRDAALSTMRRLLMNAQTQIEAHVWADTNEHQNMDITASIHVSRQRPYSATAEPHPTEITCTIVARVPYIANSTEQE